MMTNTMDIDLKQRLVGAAVLVSIGVIFVPMLLDGDGVLYNNHSDPEPPRVPERVERTLDFTLAEPPALPEVVRPEPVAPAAAPAAAAPVSTMQKPAPLGSWMVQVGSFAEPANARGLADRLKQAGHPAFVSKVRVNDSTTWRVRVGPELDRGRADKLRASLAAGDFKLVNARVVAHEP